MRPAAALLLLAACAPDAPPPPAAAPVEEIPSPAAAGSMGASLATGPDGRVYLSWIEPAADSAHALRFAELGEAGWSEPRTVAAGRGWFVNWADFPSLVVLDEGRMAAHWLQKSGAGTYAYDVMTSVSADGGRGWSAGVAPHADGTQTEHGFASMWPAGGGAAGIVWLDGRETGGGHDGHGGGGGGAMTLRGTVLGADGAPAPDVLLDGRVCDCCQTGAALTAEGPIVVYRGRTEDEVRDIHVTRQVGGAWTEGRPVHRDGWRIPACPVNGPQVAAEGRRVAVAWFAAPDDSARVQVAFSRDAGATFGAPVRLDGGRAIGRVDVVLLEGGDALVSWMEAAATGEAEVRVRRVAPDGRAGPARTVAASGGARSSGFPRMARAGRGVVLAWTATAEPSGVRTARIDPDGLEEAR